MAVDLNKILSSKIAFENIINKFDQNNYCVDSEEFSSLSYILKNNQVIVYAQKNGMLSVSLEAVTKFCKELMLIAEEYSENLSRKIEMSIKPCTTGKGKSKYE